MMNEDVLEYAIFKLKDHANMMATAYMQRSIPINRYQHGAFIAVVDMLKAAGVKVGFEMEYNEYRRKDVSEIYHTIKSVFVDGECIYRGEME